MAVGSNRTAVAGNGTAAYQGMLLPFFGATILLSAALLFSVQPLFAKVVLPTLVCDTRLSDMVLLLSFMQMLWRPP